MQAGIRECLIGMKTQKKKQSRIPGLLFIIFFLVGLSVMLYPVISNYINTKHQSYAIASYDQIISSMSQEDNSRIFEKAQEYNDRLRELASPLDNFSEISGYKDTLDITGTGIMGYITIPMINIQLPVYHGTDADVLNIAAGHLEGSTLPVGGSSTHAVISAHRGLPSARLFSDLDSLTEGDIFTVTVLDRVMTYQIDKIAVVQPSEMENLRIVNSEDYVTLLTCTPYGVNTHRLLVRGKRTDNGTVPGTVMVPSDAVAVDPVIVASVTAIPVLIIFVLVMMLSDRTQFKVKEKNSWEESGDKYDKSI